ncbi:hypothetical protein CHLRE_07g331800v5 [Chlamydomonas reinhardtii]|uniref:Carbohydrate kinase PfkB domain-containing protein n=1 Tax=Chlamydomonas reinhardtii TaxID=3055 RepID=A0A2K3DJZ6_CHLRE|nr:uncharacterized protein CHLRE_07g331800v5 [Chlamydomonas reinhardtii]PNW80841.1 hypothetical protein CHLRE_07g331800v5 [Chlamydomonas reinhardtii]
MGLEKGRAPVVVGLGDPVMDILARVSPEWLATVAPEAGGCLPVAPEEMEKLLAAAATQSELTRIPGGSAANVVKGVANIAGGHASCRFVGMVGADATGAEYRAKLSAQGVAPVLLESGSGAPSACAVCFVTPDGQRTMRTCLGASLELRSCAQLPAGWSEGCGLLHAEGYCLYRPQLAREMMSLARATGAITSIDLASFELVRNCKDSMLGLLKDGLVDLIFANEEEAVTLCTELGLLPPADGASAPDTDAAVEAAQRFLLSPTGGRCKVAVTSLGARGCVARAADGGHGAAAACRVQVVDTIGAGDFFTAGFLAAYLRGGSVQQCAAAGCASGAEAVQAKGAELPEEAFVRLRAAIDSILAAQPVAGGAAAAAAAAAGVAAAVAAVMGAGAGAGAKAVGMAAVAGSPAAAATAKPEPVAAMV